MTASDRSLSDTRRFLHEDAALDPAAGTGSAGSRDAGRRELDELEAIVVLVAGRVPAAEGSTTRPSLSFFVNALKVTGRRRPRPTLAEVGGAEELGRRGVGHVEIAQ